MKIDLRTILGSAGLSSYERRKKALRQPRDRNGRWVGAGAFVKWKSSSNQHGGGKILTGRVVAIKDGKAQVQVRNPDGTESTELHHLDPDTLGVIHSKARLPIQNTKAQKDPANNSSRWVKDHKKEILDSKDGIRVDREDGYSLEAGTGEKKNKKRSTSGDNAVMYQLYAPSGRSLGVYGEDSEDDLDDIIDTDKDISESDGAVEVPGDPSVIVDAPAPAPAPVVAAPGPLRASGVYSVPESVKNEISEALVLSVFDNDSQEKAEKFCGGSQVTLEEIAWLREELDSLEDRIVSENTERWTKKIMDKKPIQHFFDPSMYSYFTVSETPTGPSFGLIAVNLETFDVYEWRTDNFFGPVGTVDSYEAPYIEEIDSDAAQEAAYYLLDHESFIPSELYPHEKNMFKAAEPMMDMDLLDSFAYKPQERASDAASQPRSGGKFAKVNYKAPTTDEKPVEDVAKEVSDAGESEDLVYFAIVDDVDETLILDFIAIHKANGEPVVYRRSEGQWVADPEMQSRLTAAVPPTVVKISNEDAIKTILQQIDSHDGVSASEAVVAAGYALPDGSVRIMDEEDLQFRLNQYQGTSDLDTIRHIVRRATALNLRHLVPQEMLAYSSFREEPSILGTYGEVVVASASENSPLEALQKYWLFGPHSSSIEWGTDGDVDRAVPYLTKYLGPSRAEGFALSLKGLS